MANTDQKPAAAGFFAQSYHRPMAMPDYGLGELSMGDLWHMYEAYRTAFHMFGGRAGQPWANERPGGHILDNEADRCIHAMDQIFDEARRRDISPADSDADHMASLWALRVVDDGGDIASAAVFLAAHVR